MLKWIKNSKGSVTNKSSKFKGVFLKSPGNYESCVFLSKYDKKNNRTQSKYVVGYFKTEKEAVKARINYILELL
jgi:hypothetical protein